MGRAPCCDKANVKRGPWSPEEDTALRNYLERHGTGGNWIALPQKAGLRRCGKSCRLRWLNYLRPDIKHGGFTEEEDNIICSLYKSIGSRWSVIASQLPGRTDNDVKNYWNTKLKKKLFGGKTNSHTSNNFIINAENHTHQLISSSPSPASLIKSEYEYETLGFSKYTKNSTALPFPMNVFLEQNVNSSRDPIQFNLHNGLTEPSYGLGPIASYSQSSSSTQEISSLSVAPCNALDNGNISWWPSNNAGDEYDRLLMDFGFGSSYDVLSGLGGHDQRNNETAPNLANSNFLANTY